MTAFGFRSYYTRVNFTKPLVSDEMQGEERLVKVALKSFCRGIGRFRTCKADPSKLLLKLSLRE